MQVKGTLRKRFSKEKFCYRVEIADLRSYRREGVTLYFVVQISGDGIRKKIFLMHCCHMKLINCFKIVMMMEKCQ